MPMDEHDDCVFCGSRVELDQPAAICPTCAAVMHVECAAFGGGRCGRLGCRGQLVIRPGRTTITVTGSSAADVESVARSLMAQARNPPANRAKWDVWISGGFYLAVLVTAGVLILVVTKSVPFIVLPIVVVGALLSLCIVGAFQLRQDKALSEKNFLSLMGTVLTRFRVFGRGK